MISIRSDITFIISKLAQFMFDLIRRHESAVKHLL